MAYAPTETQNASDKHAFWTTSDRPVEDVPRHEQLFGLMDANARTERRENGGVGSKLTNFSVFTVKIPSTTTENYCYPLLTTITLLL